MTDIRQKISALSPSPSPDAFALLIALSFVFGIECMLLYRYRTAALSSSSASLPPSKPHRPISYRYSTLYIRTSYDLSYKLQSSARLFVAVHTTILIFITLINNLLQQRSAEYSTRTMNTQYGRRICSYDDYYYDDDDDDDDDENNDDENGEFLKSVLFQDPKVLAEFVARRLEQNNGRNGEDPLERYYEIKEHMTVFLWTLQDIMEGGEEPHHQQQQQQQQQKQQQQQQSSNETQEESSCLQATKSAPAESSSSSPSSSSMTVGESQAPRSLQTSLLLEKKKKDEEKSNNMYLSLMLPFPLESLRRVSESGFLTSNELGRLLLMTTPRIVHQLGTDFCWTCLCRAKFPQLLTWLHHHHQGPEWIVRRFSEGTPQAQILLPFTTTPPPQWPPIDEPSLQARDLQFIVSWYADKKQMTSGSPPTATLRLSGRRLNEFLQRGQVTVPMTTTTTTTDVILQVPAPAHIDQTHVTIHAVRQNNNDHDGGGNNNTIEDCSSCQAEVCCLHETYEHSWDPTPATPLNLNHAGDLYLGPGAPSLLRSYGRDLETRLARGDREAGGFEILVVAHADSEGRVRNLSLQFWANFSDRLFIYNSR
jgi:hypothetical protein